MIRAYFSAQRDSLSPRRAAELGCGGCLFLLPFRKSSLGSTLTIKNKLILHLMAAAGKVWSAIAPFYCKHGEVIEVLPNGGVVNCGYGVKHLSFTFSLFPTCLSLIFRSGSWPFFLDSHI